MPASSRGSRRCGDGGPLRYWPSCDRTEHRHGHHDPEVLPSIGTGRPGPHGWQGCSCLFSNPGLWKAGRDQKSPLRRCFKSLGPPKLWRAPPSRIKPFGVVGATTGTCEFGQGVNMPGRVPAQEIFLAFFAAGLRVCSVSADGPPAPPPGRNVAVFGPCPAVPGPIQATFGCLTAAAKARPPARATGQRRAMIGPARRDWGGSGGRTRTRTLDPLIKSQLLYQLSYAPPKSHPKEPGAPEQSRVW